jgi:hypothetical protein
MFNKFSSENCAVYEIMRINTEEPDRPQMAIKYGARALYAGYLRLQTHIQNMQYALLVHGNNGYANEPQCYVHMHTACLVLSNAPGYPEERCFKAPALLPPFLRM